MGKVVTREWRKAKVINWNLHLFQLLEIIQVLDSISWVRCASCNVCIRFLLNYKGKETKCFSCGLLCLAPFMGESCRIKYLFTFELSANTKQRFMSGRVLVSLIQNSATRYFHFLPHMILVLLVLL